MVCGSYSLLGHDTDISTNDVAHLSKAIFNGLPGDLLRIFGEGGLPSIRLAKLEEEVPTGDVAVYLHHLAQASMSSSLANVSLLLHPDFLEHVRPWKMSQVFQALLNGAWSPSVDFLYLGWRHEGPVSPDGRVASHLRYHCDVEPWEGGKIGPCDSGYNPRLLQNLWRMVFGTDLSPFAGDDLGGGLQNIPTPGNPFSDLFYLKKRISTAQSRVPSGRLQSRCLLGAPHDGGWGVGVGSVPSPSPKRLRLLSTAGDPPSRGAAPGQILALPVAGDLRQGILRAVARSPRLGSHGAFSGFVWFKLPLFGCLEPAVAFFPPPPLFLKGTYSGWFKAEPIGSTPFCGDPLFHT